MPHEITVLTSVANSYVESHNPCKKSKKGKKKYVLHLSLGGGKSES